MQIADLDFLPGEVLTPAPGGGSTEKRDLTVPLFGPNDDYFVHYPGNGFLESRDGPSVKGDVLVEATFLNPYTDVDLLWQHGFLLKNEGGNRQYFVLMDSDGNWEWSHRLGGARVIGKTREKTEDIDRSVGGRNLLQVVMIGNRGWVYINGNFQGQMDLSVDTGGDVVSVFIDDSHDGETRYEDFAVWEWSPARTEVFTEVDPNEELPMYLEFPRSYLLHGPEDGRLVHDPGSGTLKTILGTSTPMNVLIEATFLNPYETADKIWEHGILLKKRRGNEHHALYINSDGVWANFHRLGKTAPIGLRDRETEYIDREPGGKNLLQIVKIGDKGWVYINGHPMGVIDLSVDTGGDGISIFVLDSHAGETLIEDFSIWKWHPDMAESFQDFDPQATPAPTPTPNPLLPIYGPESGAILHNSSDEFMAGAMGVRIQEDLMVEVTFEVPFAPNESHWNFGLLFGGELDVYHRIELTSKFGGSYVHWRRGGIDEDVRGGTAEDLPGLNLGKGEKNHIRFIVVEKEGWLYVNDRRAAIIPFSLGNLPNPEQVSLAINDIDSDGYEYSRGGRTDFEDFTVWRWHPSLFELPRDD